MATSNCPKNPKANEIAKMELAPPIRSFFFHRENLTNLTFCALDAPQVSGSNKFCFRYACDCSIIS